VWVVTRGAVAVSPSDPIAMAQAPLWGFGRVAALEHPDSWGGLVDLDPASESLAGLECVLADAGEDQLAIRNGRLHVPRLDRAVVPHARASVAADAAYLVTGGLGALGLEVAQRLADRGARHLVLLGRRAPGDAARDRIARLERQGVTVRVEQADVSLEDDVRRVFERLASTAPPLRGVVHAAGANGHHPIAELDAATFRAVVSAKISGAWRLHEQTQGMPLDFFVCFSSIASVWGSKGQAHYAAANACLDALVSLRIQQGLPALSLNWGPWTAGGGMATAEAQRWLGRVGVRPLAPASALDALEARLASSGHAVIADIDWPRFLDVYQSRRASPFFRRMAADAGDAAPQSAPAARAAGLAETIRAKGPVDGRRALVLFVRDRVVQVMNLDPGNAPASHQGFFSIGFDSLMALELKNRIAADLDVALPSTLAFDYPNIGDLAEYLAGGVLRLDHPNPEPRTPNPESRIPSPDVPADVQASIDATLDRLGKLMGKP
jgi:acyl carrier protein